MSDDARDDLGPLAPLVGVWEGARRFELRAEVGSQTFGICSNPFLDREFKTLRYQLKFEVRDTNSISYWEDTVLQLKGQDELFHHTDEHVLSRAD